MTAVEFILEKLFWRDKLTNEEIEQAKQMEKEQMGILDIKCANSIRDSKEVKPLTEGSIKTTFGKNNPTVDIKQTAPPPSPKVPEISDEEIEAAIHRIYGRDCEDFYAGAEWYREQLKLRQ